MNTRHLKMLKMLRERREQQAHRALEICREAENKPRAAAADAQTALAEEQTGRLAFAAQWGPQHEIATSASEQMAQRSCLGRLDGEVERRIEVLNKAQALLDEVVQATEAGLARLKAARNAMEKSWHNAERFRDALRQQEFAGEEGELDEETEIQAMSRFARSRQKN